MSQGEVPYILVTVFRDEKEVLKKAVHVQSFGELEPLIRAQCSSVRDCALERTLVYCKTFEDYLDTTNHKPQMHDRFQLRFSSTHCIPEKHTNTNTDTSECGLSCQTVGSSVPETSVNQYHSYTVCEDLMQPTWTGQEGKESKVTQRSSVKNNSVNTMLDISTEEIQSLSRIYGKGKSDETLSKYQIEINKQAHIIAMENPLLLKNRGELMSEARKRLHATGYKYKRANSSRSKVFGKNSSSAGSSIKYETSRIRNDRLLVIRAEIQSMEKQLALYEQGKEKSVKGGLYVQGATFEELALEVKKRIWTLKAEESGITQKMISSLKRKRQPTDASFGDSEIRRKLHFTKVSKDSCTDKKDNVALIETPTLSAEWRAVNVDESTNQEGLFCVATV